MLKELLQEQVCLEAVNGIPNASLKDDLSFYLEGKVMTDKDQKQVFALSSESTHTIGMKPDHNLHHP